MTARPDEVVAWRLESGGYVTFWQSEEVARAEYKNLLILGHGKDTTLTPVVEQVALQSANARLADLTEENAASEEIWARKCDELDKRLAAVLALADEWEKRQYNSLPGDSHRAAELRRAAAGEGDGND